MTPKAKVLQTSGECLSPLGLSLQPSRKGGEPAGLSTALGDPSRCRPLFPRWRPSPLSPPAWACVVAPHLERLLAHPRPSCRCSGFTWTRWPSVLALVAEEWSRWMERMSRLSGPCPPLVEVLTAATQPGRSGSRVPEVPPPLSPSGPASCVPVLPSPRSAATRPSPGRVLASPR